MSGQHPALSSSSTVITAAAQGDGRVEEGVEGVSGVCLYGESVLVLCVSVVCVRCQLGLQAAVWLCLTH